MTVSPGARELALKVMSCLEDAGLDGIQRAIARALDAARTAGIEAAAAVCDELADRYVSSPGYIVDRNVAIDLAESIRSLKEKPHAG